MRKARARIFAVNEPDVTCGGPDGRRLLAFGLQAAALAWPTALAVLAAPAWPAARMAGGWPGEASAAAAPRTSADAASLSSGRRSPGRHASPPRALTRTPRAGRSGPH